MLRALAVFVRQRLAEPRPSSSVATARHVATVIIGATAPFAATPHARLRLLRQMHASGLLTERETEQAVTVLGVPR